MADVLKIALLIAGALTVFISYWLAAEALFPTMVARAREQYETRWFRATLLGLGVGLPAVLIGVALGQAPNPAAKLLSLLILTGPILFGLVGSAGLSQRIGLGLPALTDEQQPWRRGLRGAVVLALTFLLPVIGWFILLPWAVVSGLGAFLLGWKQQRRELPAATEALEAAAPVE